MNELELMNMLSEDKKLLIHKHRLIKDSNQLWYRQLPDLKPHYIFPHKYLLEFDIDVCVYRIYGLCNAKIGILWSNKKFIVPQKYRNNKFVDTEWWDVEFLYFIISDKRIDLRQLQAIRKFGEFKKLLKVILPKNKEEIKK